MNDFAAVSDLFMEAAIVAYAGALLAYLTEILFASRPDRARAAQAASVGSRSANPAAARTVEVTTGDLLVLAAADEPAGGATPHRWAERANRFGRIGLAVTVVAFGFHLASVITRGLAAGRVPWGNMYEFSTMGALAAVAVFLVALRRYDLRWLGVWVDAAVLVTLGIAVTVLYAEAAPLLPALRSTWLVIHVLAAITGSGLLTVAALVTAMYLLRLRREQRLLAGAEPGRLDAYLARLPTSDALDRVSFRLHAVAFPLWPFAVVAGAIWAQYAWGRYWGWDPKETWSLVTWLIFAGYLHARSTAGWKGRAAAIVALVGYASFLFNYFGVNLLFSGLHAYSGL